MLAKGILLLVLGTGLWAVSPYRTNNSIPAPHAAQHSTPLRIDVLPKAQAICGTYEITYYYPTGQRTATGTWPVWGQVAVDPLVIPLGSWLRIAGLPIMFQATDTGGAVRGYHIDVFSPDAATARRWRLYGEKRACWWQDTGTAFQAVG